MSRFLKNKEKIIGQIPGEAIFIGDKKIDEVRLTVFDYDSENFRETSLSSVKELIAFKESQTVTWINIYGLHDVNLIKEIGDIFNIHALTIEDILNTGQRPKMEDFDDYLLFTLKNLHYNKEEESVVGEQLSIILSDNFVLTFQERPREIFEHVRNRIRKNKGRIRKNGSDYLTYALLDTIVDRYLFIVGQIGEEIEELQVQLINNHSRNLLNTIYMYKQEISYIRKTIWPVKEFILQLSRFDTDFIKENTYPFLKDALDLVTETVEVTDIYSVMLSDYLDMYNSAVNNKLNEIMKVLTIFSVIFIPLTFVTSIYGMNFDNMPELHYKYGYFILCSVLLVSAGIMIMVFKKKKWL